MFQKKRNVTMNKTGKGGCLTFFSICVTLKVTNSHKQFTPRAETSKWETVTKGLVLGLFDYTQTGLC